MEEEEDQEGSFRERRVPFWVYLITLGVIYLFCIAKKKKKKFYCWVIEFWSQQIPPSL